MTNPQSKRRVKAWLCTNGKGSIDFRHEVFSSKEDAEASKIYCKRYWGHKDDFVVPCEIVLTYNLPKKHE